ncbi:hypothetical protein EVAR_101744_1 [Eumeta japonica]|uniref:Uncharacterized protein n=1 Tax=Eumeta variegata TaxID=151549 RepID=A0A4C1SMY4_EUMVA|nr:hypothetical protein EVAR_101744_1 [Eumeta japonica]
MLTLTLIRLFRLKGKWDQCRLEMRSLRSMCGVSQKDRCRNRDVREWKFEAGCMAPLVNRIRARNNSYVILDIPGFADQRPDSADHGQIHEQQPRLALARST